MAGAWCHLLGAEDRPDMRRALGRLLEGERIARERLGGDVAAAFERSETGGLIVTWRLVRPMTMAEDSGPGRLAA